MPIEPNVEIIVKPTGPQLQAPATDPRKELKTLPLIFPLDFFKILIRYMFIGITTADNTERITINTNPNSVPCAIWPMMYGSKKRYSEITESPISMNAKIADDNTM